MNFKQMITCLAIALPIAAFGTLPANASNHQKGPKVKQEKSDALFSAATVICGESPDDPDGENYKACDLWFATDGHRVEGPGNKCTDDDTGNATLIYSGRNCNLNEETLLRDAASMVLQTHDAVVIAAQEGDSSELKWCEVRVSHGSYHGSFYELESEGKIEGESVSDIYGLLNEIQYIVDMTLGSFDCGT